jgi:hypothetical protein
MRSFRILALIVVLGSTGFGQTVHAVRGKNAKADIAALPVQHQTIVRAIYENMNVHIPGPPPGDRPNTATFVVTYTGFTPQAQAAFQRAVDIWASILVSSVPIRVTATWTALGPGVLGSAGASTLYRNFPNAPVANTWYAVALAEKLSGTELNATTVSDINANFSSAIANWYFGTDGNCPPGQYDLVSVVLHELGHGLTFAGTMTVSGGQGSWGLGSGFPIVYERFAENGAGQSLINTTLFPNPSAALATQLQSNAVYFNGPEAVAASGGTRPLLYAPSTWLSGSSFSHLDETLYPAGNPNSLMTPAFGMAEAIHMPGPIILGMFRDMGWTTGSTGGSAIKYEERFAGTTIPAGWRVVDRDGGGTPLSFVQRLNFTSGDSVLPQSGASFWHGSFEGANASGLIDELLIGPRVRNIIAGDSLYFYAGAIGDQYPDSLRVFISTTDSTVTSFTNQIGYFRVAGTTGSWHLYGFDLTPFAGSDIFFAVNYYIVDGGPVGTSSDNVWVDHFVVTTDGPTSVDDRDRNVLPQVTRLVQNYPNPFNPSTTLRFTLAQPSHVTLTVYDLLGRAVTTLVDADMTTGEHAVQWNGGDVAGGVYFARMQAGGSSETRRMMLVK